MKCCSCGRFLSYDEMLGSATFDYTPSSDRSKEECNWTCVECTVANTVANPYAPVVANPDRVANVANKPRYVKWREANPELWLERQRGYQAKHRKRRAKAKEAGK